MLALSRGPMETGHSQRRLLGRRSNEQYSVVEINFHLGAGRPTLDPNPGSTYQNVFVAHTKLENLALHSQNSLWIGWLTSKRCIDFSVQHKASAPVWL